MTAPRPALHRRLFVPLLALALLSGAACRGRPSSSTGSLELLVAFGGPAAKVARVAIEVLTPKLTPLQPRVLSELPQVDGRWTGVLESLPAQAVVISAVATDAAGAQLFHGETLVVVHANRTTLLVMTLQPEVPVEAGPTIVSASASASRVDFQQTVSLAATATDKDPAEVPGLKLSWSATVGSFEGPADQGAAVWRAPSGPVSLVATLRITATDSKGLQDSKTLDVVVGAGASAALVIVELNSWPRIDALSTNALVVPSGGLAHLHGTAHDPDGDALTYSWSLDTCQGTFPGGSNAPDADLYFQAPAAQQTCTVKLAVSDGRGGSVRGTLVLTNAPALAAAPVVDLAFISDPRIFDGSIARLTLAAHDPSDPTAPMIFTWTAHAGILTNLSATSTTGSVSFQSAPCSGDAWAAAQVQSARGGLVTEIRFALLNCAPSCRELKRKNGALGDGVQTIDPDGTADGTQPPIQVFCDMTTDGGGWTFLAHHDATTTGARWFDAPLGTYLTSRAGAPTYSLGILPLVGATEMMVALGAASPAEAAAGQGLVLLTHRADAANFLRGPLPCATGVAFGYRSRLDLPYSDSSNWRCDALAWVARDPGGADLLGFGGPGVLAGPSIGGSSGWGHAAWIYVR